MTIVAKIPFDEIPDFPNPAQFKDLEDQRRKALNLADEFNSAIQTEFNTIRMKIKDKVQDKYKYSAFVINWEERVFELHNDVEQKK